MNLRIVRNTAILTFVCFVCFYSCQSDEMISDDYNPASIEDIEFEEDAAGSQFLAYINRKSLDSICVLNYTNFEVGSSIIEEIEKKELIDLAVVLNTYEDYNISIEGHTNNLGSANVNLLLSEARADRVFTYLKSRNVDALRMQIRGYGEERPRASNDTVEGRKLNQRVEIAILH